MAKSPGESKIPVFHTNPLKSRISKPLSTLSSRVKAHLDATKSRASPSSVLFGILSVTGGNLKNVTVGKSIAVPQFSNNRHSSSHDDLKSKALIKRPTNIFTTGHFFPSAVNESNEHAVPVTGIEHVGKKVRLNSGKEGILRFIGETKFGEGVWCGVELDKEEGSIDGTVNNIRYFNCAKNRGIFVLATNVSLVSEEVREYFSDVSDSGPHSLLGITGDIEQIHNDNTERPSTSDINYFHKESLSSRFSGSHLQLHSQTPTPNSSTGSFIASSEWKCNSRHSSSTGSLFLSHRAISSALETCSVQMSKHSSFECDESLGILTPDQMGELTTYSGDVTVLGTGSCDDFRSLTFQEAVIETCEMKSDIAQKSIQKYASMDETVETSALIEYSARFNENVAESGNNELQDRLLSETDTFMISISSTGNNVEPSKSIVHSSPSLEELPLDELSTTLIATEQIDSSEILPPPPPTSFVTSVTSIGSWDNGYQGDGECSRPTSRGADASPLARVPKILAKVLDPMTDSDFYTESDVDLYEDVTYFKGDRKARIIDGKLFGSPVNTKMITSQSYGTQILSSELHGTQLEHSVPEEMDSSGIYSDLEKKMEGIEKQDVNVYNSKTPEEIVLSDGSGQSSSKSVSSQKLIIKDTKEKPKENDAEIVERKNTVIKEAEVKSKINSKQDVCLKRRNDMSVKCKESSKSSESSLINKSKMPRRNIPPKVRNVITPSSKCCQDENQENHQPTVNLKNNSKKINGRWDSIMLKIEKGKSDVKSKSEKLKDVKSKVMCGVPRVPPNKLHKDVKPFSPIGNAMNKVALPNKNSTTLSGSTRSLRDNSVNHRAKSRKTRNRIGLELTVQSSVRNNLKSLSQASSRNSSVTDISDSHVDISQHSLPAVITSSRYTKGKKSSSLLCSPLSDGAVSAGSFHSMSITTKDSKTSTLSRTRSNLNQNRVINSNIGACPINKSTPLKPLVDHHTNRSPSTCKSIKVKTKQLSQISKINPLLSQLKYATDGMEAFIILFQRLTIDMDVFALPCIKQELLNYKKDWLDMKLKLEEANASYKKIKEEIDIERLLHEQKLKELREIHMVQLDRLKKSHERQLIENSDIYTNQLNDLQNELRTQEHILQAKFKEEIQNIQNQAEQKLQKILEETKNQVELLKIENDTWKEKLIKESWRKLQDVEKKFKNKMENMETNYVNQLNEANNEAKKREELFLMSMKRKPAGYHDAATESNSEVIKFNSENVYTYGCRTNCQNLEEEICSLRTVLDLKHSEIQELRKQNEKLRKETQDLPFVLQKLDSTQARVEDLNAQLEAKTENEKKLLKENRRLIETVQYENEKKKRLTFQNEELLWKLKKSTQVAKTLAVFNSNRNKEERVSESDAICFHSTPKNTIRYPTDPTEDTEKYLRRSRTDNDIKLIESPSDGEVSPKVLGVVEKSDSVSWVLEIDESPLTVASRMLRRANSLRGVPSKKSTARNLQSFTLPIRNKKVSTNVSCSVVPTPSTISNSNVTTSDPKTENVEKANCEDCAKNINVNVAKNEEDESAIMDIASFFDFLQDSDFETDSATMDDETDVRTDYYTTEKGLTSPFSNTSSDSSLDIDSYDRDMKSLSYARFMWTNTNNCESNVNMPKKNITDSSSVSDSEESESVDNFPSSIPESTNEKIKTVPSQFD